MSQRSNFLPTLTSDTRVVAADAFIDRIQLDIGEWALFGPIDSICSSLTSFSQSNVITVHGEALPLFNGHIVQNLYGLKKLKFTANPNSDSFSQAKTLVSGAVKQVQWRFSRVSHQAEEKARIAFATQLNLTRFTQAQQLKRISPLHRPHIAAGYVLAIDPEPAWYEDEVPLVPSTNIIIGPEQKYGFAMKQPRTEQLTRYLKLVRGMLSRVMADSFSNEEATYKRFSGYSLKEIEFYWEFDQPNPIDFIEAIRPSVIAASKNFREHTYNIQTASYSIDGQSPCLKISATRDIQIKIYAKTNRRVRFEVTLRDAAISRASKNRTSVTSRELISKIPSLAEEAANRLNFILEVIAHSPAPRSSLTSVHLVHMIVRASDDPYISETIIAALATFGRVTSFNNDPLLSAIHRLKDRKVLRNLKPRSKVYIVTNEYRASLEKLRELR